ncbi:MAG TPA: type IV toxin-antitoxin system AbiEi family antitoxin domain-containing protein [Acidimicrobiia bacterium]|nr:type IV toxin-antitoxin system AbiEi family antitoxin domain-containing protein [Acidimicrobiia bacterium]
MRRLLTIDEARAAGLSESAIRWGERQGALTRLARGVYGEGDSQPTALDRAVAAAIAAGGIPSGRLAAVLHGLDGIELRGPDFTVPPTASGRRPGARRRRLPLERVVEVNGVPCTNGLQTLVDLAADFDDLAWEQALESALRQRLTTVAELDDALDAMGRARTPGVGRMRRVLALRPAGAPATESLLETLMVQLIRTVDGLEDPVRQHEVYDEHGGFAGRVDLCWPDPGVFVELDGQQHADQPVYDARRETAVVAATGWLPGRFTWHEVTRLPRVTARRLDSIVGQARKRTDG